MEIKQTYERRIESELGKLDAQIHELTAKTATASAEILIEAKEHLRTLRVKREEMQERLKELKEPGVKAWEDLKAGIEVALGELKSAVAAARSRFR